MGVKKSFLKKGRGKPQAQAGFSHQKELGQNFLHDKALLDRLTECVELLESDVVLEVGAGMGDMSLAILRRAARLVTVEVDEALYPFLAVALEGKNARLIRADVRALDIEQIIREEGVNKIVANIPYYLTNELVLRFLAAAPLVDSISLLVQREAAERMLARPHTALRCPLSVRLEVLCDGRVAAPVERACFSPPPRVDSAFVHLRVRREPLVAPQRQAAFFRFVDMIFSGKRKTVANNVAAALQGDKAAVLAAVEGGGLAPTVRAEEMSVEAIDGLMRRLWPETAELR